MRARPREATYTRAMVLAILGVTGYTGRLVLAEARRAGLEVRLVGRRREALEELAAPGEEVRVADARDEARCARRSGCVGRRLLRRAVPRARPRASRGGGRRGSALPRHDRRAGVRPARLTTGSRPSTVVLPAFGFDYVPGDLAARLAAEQVDGPLDEVVVAYSVKGVGTSRGTRRTIGAVMGQKQVAWEDGRLVRLSLRRDDAHGALPVRRADGRRVERHRAAHGAAAHRRPQRALLHPGAGASRRRPVGSAG